MDALHFKRTKIIATIGPASETPEKIHALLAAGVNGARLNMSHGTHAEHALRLIHIRASAKKLERSVAIIADLQGPKIRLGNLPAGGVEIAAGDTLRLAYEADYTSTGIFPIQYDFSTAIQKGDALFLRDGQVKTTVQSVRNGVISARAHNSGKVLSKHGINLPDTKLDKSVITDKDRIDIAWALKHDVDYVALSFVQTAEDIIQLRKILIAAKSDIKIIAKIETKLATKHLTEIINASDAVMVARGDLATETYPEEVPVLQRRIIAYGRVAKKPVIVATQMLESMMNSLQPSRAEVSDIASAVGSATDAVMLSGETAAGNYPVETVVMMKRVILKMEEYLTEMHRHFDVPPDSDQQSDTGVAYAAVSLARQLKVKIILAETLTGSTALGIASFRPYQSIVMLSPHMRICNQLAIVWGSKPFLTRKRFEAEGRVFRILKKRGNLKSGDMIVTAFGKQRGVAGGTDTVRLIQVP